MPNLYYVMFDTNSSGIRVFNYSKYRKNNLFKMIANDKIIPEYHRFFQNAKRLKQEVYIVESELSEQEILNVGKQKLTEFYQLVQEHGTLIYKSNKTEL